MAAAGRQVISTDLYPRDGSEPRDFLKAAPVVAGASVVTNPPNCRADAFIERGLRLLDRGAIVGIALLLRHDYLQAGSRVATFNRATHVVHCNWRAIWVDGTDGQPRWAFHWVLWTDRPRLYLQLRQVIRPAPHTLPETQRKRWKENKMPVISPA
jgi:hypothetical protein